MRRSRACLLVVTIALAACGGAETGLPSGLLAAPMLAGGARSAASGVDGGADGAAFAHRALPPEPHEPSGMACRRNVSCHEEDEDVPIVPLPAPFEHCPPASGKVESGFSVQETTAQRQWEPHTCCYVEFLDCKRSNKR